MYTNESRQHLLINHYKIMSREYFFEVKVTRGDVHLKKWDTLRDERYFQMFDYSEEEDLTLKNRIVCKENLMCSRI